VNFKFKIYPFGLIRALSVVFESAAHEKRRKRFFIAAYALAFMNLYTTG
jgi:hypothetical protein